MRILINNLDGLGSVDYTHCVQFGAKTLIRRVLNAPSTCQIPLILDKTLPCPKPLARLVVQSSTNTYLFTGLITENFNTAYLGVGRAGLVQQIMINAISDEAQLDVDVWKTQTTLLNGTAAQNWQTLGLLAAQSGLQLILSDGLIPASRVVLSGGSTWSEIAGRLANSTRSTYRALNNVIEVMPIGVIKHSIAPYDSQISFSTVDEERLRWLANDITIFGHAEPDAYVTEVFQGDGLTSTFALSATPFHPSSIQAQRLIDQFQGNVISSQLWTVSDPNGHIGLTEQGLTCAGGSGRAGESVVTSVQGFELGGNILIEAEGVRVQTGSQGIIVGLFTGHPATDTCFVGFKVNSSVGSTTLTPLINGTEAGDSVTLSASGSYTLRIRLSILDVQRVGQTYCYRNDANSATSGGAVTSSSGQIVISLQDSTNGAIGPSSILYQSSVAMVPTACHLAPLVSGSLACGIQRISYKQSAPVQVSVMTAGSHSIPLAVGTLSEGGACHLESTGQLVFYPSSIPSAGALLFVSYRDARRAVARTALQPSPSGTTTASSWAGVVLDPPASSSLDCEAAAEALLAYYASGESAKEGIYQTIYVFCKDFWPGDYLELTDPSGTTVCEVIIRGVKIHILDTASELLEYVLSFANDQAKLIAMELSPHVPETSSFPLQATNLDRTPPALSALVVTNASSTSVTVDTGREAPLNGGFEVRRRNYTFGSQVDSDLVLRTSARAFSIPRVSAIEEFFIRMYDGDSPPRYSGQSSAIFVNVLS